MFSSPEAFGEALRDAGFDVLTTANNHSCDRGRYGVVHTIDVLDSLGIATTGSYRTREERTSRTPLLVTVKGVKLAILAYTYGTNGLPIPSPALVDTISRAQIARDLQRADSLGADYKIVQIHWGNEYERLPNKRQKDLAQWLTDQGVHAIIGSHPHVVQEHLPQAPGYPRGLDIRCLFDGELHQQPDHPSGDSGWDAPLPRAHPRSS